jgi:hypothetical protein
MKSHDHTLLLAAQQALLGAIGPHVLAVAVGRLDGVITMTSFVDDAITLEELRDLDDAAEAIAAEVPWAEELELVTRRLATPVIAEAVEGEWVFMRREVGLDGIW